MKAKLFSLSKLIFAACLLVISIMAADIKVGSRAPAFALSNSDGKVTRLSSLVGKKKIVLVFFRTLH